MSKHTGSSWEGLHDQETCKQLLLASYCIRRDPLYLQMGYPLLGDGISRPTERKCQFAWNPSCSHYQATTKKKAWRWTANSHHHSLTELSSSAKLFHRKVNREEKHQHEGRKQGRHDGALWLSISFFPSVFLFCQCVFSTSKLLTNRQMRSSVMWYSHYCHYCFLKIICLPHFWCCLNCSN